MPRRVIEFEPGSYPLDELTERLSETIRKVKSPGTPEHRAAIEAGYNEDVLASLTDDDFEFSEVPGKFTGIEVVLLVFVLDRLGHQLDDLIDRVIVPAIRGDDDDSIGKERERRTE